MAKSTVQQNKSLKRDKPRGNTRYLQNQVLTKRNYETIFLPYNHKSKLLGRFLQFYSNDNRESYDRMTR